MQRDYYGLHEEFACPVDESTMYERFLVPERADGMHVFVQGDDTPYLDLVMGYSSLNFGHNNPEITGAASKALQGLTQIHSFHTPHQLELSRYLVDRLAPGAPFRVYFDVGGSNAVGAAIRMCRAFTGRRTIVCFTGGFHGTGYAAAAVSDPRLLDPSQYGDNPLLDDVVRVPFPDSYRGPGAAECAGELERVLDDTSPAAVIIEPVQGAAGFILPEGDFLPQVREITRSRSIPLIDDEIQVGIGRAGYLYCVERWNVVPDVVLLSKSLAAGCYPLSAVIARSELFSGVPARGTAFQSTFNNNPLGTTIALRTLQMMERRRLMENAARLGSLLLQELAPMFEFPWIGDLRGLGLAIAFEIVTDRTSRDPDPAMAKRFVEAALDEHVIVYASGVHRNVIKVAPPINITVDDVRLIGEKIRRCAERAGGGFRA